MKTKVMILAVSCMLLITALSTGCFDTAHHTRVSVVAYQTEIDNPYDGKYHIYIEEFWTSGAGAMNHKGAKYSNMYNFSLKNGEWKIYISDQKENIYAWEKWDIIFVTNDDTKTVLIVILIPEGGSANDVDSSEIVIVGAETKSVEQ